MGMRKCENLSRRQRRSTPLPFARYLVDRVLSLHPSDHVAVLWVAPDSNYWRLWPLCELWGVGRDARKYDGPWPIVAHPPCGCWGKFKWNCTHSKEHGIIAMELVHKYGGIVEQPVGSSLFREHGDGRDPERVNQADWGHPALKPTLLYVV
jgi:hypothetical protein